MVARGRNRVIPASAQGVAPADPAQSEPASFDRSVVFQRFQRVGGTCRLIAAIEPDPRAEEQAICANWQSSNMGEWGHGGYVGQAGGRGKGRLRIEGRHRHDRPHRRVDQLLLSERAVSKVLKLCSNIAR